jgi:hypothetical protein
MIHSRTDKQHSGDSYFREHGFVPTHSHGTFLWILRPVSATLASQATQTFPKSHSPCDVFSADEGESCISGSSQQPSGQVQFHGSLATPSGRWKKGHAHKWQLPPHQGLGTDSDGVVSGGQGGEWGFWVPAWVYIPGGDLTTPVISTATLGLACLPMAVTLGLAYWHISLSFSGWFLRPSTH